jgi:hypothetical protein
MDLQSEIYQILFFIFVDPYLRKEGKGPSDLIRLLWICSIKYHHQHPSLLAPMIA